MHPVTHIQLLMTTVFGAIGASGVAVGEIEATVLSVAICVAITVGANRCRTPEPEPESTMHVRETRSGIIVETPNNTYAFHHLRGDDVRGGLKKDIEGKITYVGDNLSKHFVRSHNLDEVPEAVLEKASEHYTVVDGVDGGWVQWNGRPEFSDTYVDVSEATDV